MFEGIFEKKFLIFTVTIALTTGIFTLGIGLATTGELFPLAIENREGIFPIAMHRFDDVRGFDETVSIITGINQGLRSKLLNNDMIFLQSASFQAELRKTNEPVSVVILDFSKFPFLNDSNTYILGEGNESINKSDVVVGNIKIKLDLTTVSFEEIENKNPYLIQLLNQFGQKIVMVDSSKYDDFKTQFQLNLVPFFNIIFGNKAVVNEIGFTFHGRYAWTKYNKALEDILGAKQERLTSTTVDMLINEAADLSIIIASYQIVIGGTFVLFSVIFLILSIWKLLAQIHPTLALLKRMGFTKGRIMLLVSLHFLISIACGLFSGLAIAVLSLSAVNRSYLDGKTLTFLIANGFGTVIGGWIALSILLFYLNMILKLVRINFADGEVKLPTTTENIFKQTVMAFFPIQFLVVIMTGLLFNTSASFMMIVLFFPAFFAIGLFFPSLIERVGGTRLTKIVLRTQKPQIILVRRLFGRQFLLPVRLFAAIGLLVFLLSSFLLAANQSFLSVQTYNQGGELTFELDEYNASLVEEMKTKYDEIKIGIFLELDASDLLGSFDLFEQNFRIIGIQTNQQTLDYLISFQHLLLGNSIDPETMLQQLQTGGVKTSDVDELSAESVIWYDDGNLSRFEVYINGSLDLFPKFGSQLNFIKLFDDFAKSNTVFLSYESVFFLINKTHIPYTVHYNIRIDLDQANGLADMLQRIGVQSISLLSKDTPIDHLLAEPGFLIAFELLLLIVYFTFVSLSDFRQNMIRPLFLLHVNRKGKETRKLIYNSFRNSLVMLLGISFFFLFPFISFLISSIFFLDSIARSLGFGIAIFLIASTLSIGLLKIIQTMVERQVLALEQDFRNMGANATIILEG